MRIARITPAVGNPEKHRRPPRIAAHQPIAVFAHELVVSRVAGHALIQETLRRQRHEQVVRAPDERHADAIRDYFSATSGTQSESDSVAIILSEHLLEILVDIIVEREMAKVDERVILVVPCLFFAHPRIVRSEFRVTLRVIEKLFQLRHAI